MARTETVRSSTFGLQVILVLGVSCVVGQVLLRANGNGVDLHDNDAHREILLSVINSAHAVSTASSPLGRALAQARLLKLSAEAGGQMSGPGHDDELLHQAWRETLNPRVLRLLAGEDLDKARADARDIEAVTRAAFDALDDADARDERVRAGGLAALGVSEVLLGLGVVVLLLLRRRESQAEQLRSFELEFNTSVPGLDADEERTPRVPAPSVRPVPPHKVISTDRMVSFVLDPQGFIVSAHGNMAKLRFGANAQSFVGQSAITLGARSPELTAALIAALRGEEVLAQAGIDGLTMEVRYTPVFEAQHKLLRVQGVMSDVSPAHQVSTHLVAPRPLTRPVPLRARVEELCAAFQSQTAAKGMKVSVAVPPGLGAAVNAQMLSEILEHLLVHAVTTANPGGSVTVEAREEAGKCLVTLNDDGPGLPPALLQVLTGPSLSGPHPKGVEMPTGLLQAREMLERCGTTLGVASVVGHGTSFHFSLLAGDLEPPRSSRAA